MPSPSPELDLDVIERIVEETCFAPSESSRVGVELEWLTLPTTGEDGPVELEPARVLLEQPGALPAGSALSFEPGGQLELSTQPCHSPVAACDALARDESAVRSVTGALGIELVALGMDPVRRPTRVVDSPRYRAMEEYLSLDGSAGKKMMCSTAAVQVNVDTGSGEEIGERWHLAHSLGPTLAAAFANSPLFGGRPTGFKSARLANWWSIDPSRTSPAATGRRCVDDWTRYALDARVMMIRRNDSDFVALGSGLSFREWVSAGHELGHPTADDLEYHMSTLFPPVRPRGHLELRYMDSLPEPWWRVAVAVTTCLLDDPEAHDAALGAADRTAGMWQEAASCGLDHPALADSARECFEAALEALDHEDGVSGLRELVASYLERYVSRGRCPADERLEEWRNAASLVPAGAAAEASWT